MKPAAPPSLPGTSLLDLEGDIASTLVDGADAFLLAKLTESIKDRTTFWNRTFTSPEAYSASVDPNRERLARMVGIREPRPLPTGLEYVSTTDQSALLAKGSTFEAHAVRWPAFSDVYGEGLLLTPIDGMARANVVAIPDADQTPEQICGMDDGIDVEAQYARRLAECGCCVVVPTLISRSEATNGISHREYLYRSAYELGRHLIGYELQKVMAIVDWFEQMEDGLSIGVIGWGEGGLLALYAGAIDPRIDATGVSGYFDSRHDVWREPIERNVFGLLEQFGDAEIASLVAPRTLVIEACAFPEVNVDAGEGKGAPCTLQTPTRDRVEKELARYHGLVEDLDEQTKLIVSGSGDGPFGTDQTLMPFLAGLGVAWSEGRSTSLDVAGRVNTNDRHVRQVAELHRHNQAVLNACTVDRDGYFEALDTTSLDTFKETIEPFRRAFSHEVIGHFGDDTLPFNARSRLLYDEPDWTGYEVVLDVFPGVIAYGILGLPKGLEDGERRPVVVCQHGLEGRPQVVMDGSRDAYNDFGAKLCQHGFVVFAPQNLYLFTDRFRSLQRKAYPLKKTLFSLIVPQHRQITDWLKTLPYVDPERIAFYGISYGGKTAMRVPPLVDNYCLSICSADFNEWVWKNASIGNRYTYADKGEYEIFEWDLGGTFNYAEMARLICPRPFMVERGHDDGVAPDEAVAYEYAKVKRFYDKLGIGDRTEMEVFDGGHEIRLEGTLRFLQKHLAWEGKT